MTVETKRTMFGSLVRIVVLGIAAVSLAGCIIVPEHHWYRPAPYYYR